MKIISKFKDYYDGIAHQYPDKEILYLRERKIVFPKKEEVPELRVNAINVKWDRYNRQRAEWATSLEVIGFCGRFYPAVVIKNTLGPDPIIHRVAYSIAELAQALAEKKIGLPDRDRLVWYYRDRYDHHRTDYERYFQTEVKGEKIANIFALYNTPCFVVRPDSVDEFRSKTIIELNPCLKDYEFPRIVDPYTAYQELNMFIGGVLRRPEQPMIAISDKDKAHKRGFDKWSFRRPPRKK